MPYSSKRQQRYFHFLESEGKMPKKTVKEYDAATDFDELPEEAEGYAHGGMIEPENNYDYDMGHATSYDSSGEPGTEDDVESEGEPRRMNRGGKVNMDFAKALRRSR